MIITAVSADIIWEEKERNLNNFSRLLDSLPYKSDVILFPEMFSTGFTMNHEMAEDMDGISIKWLKKESAKRDAAIFTSVPVGSNNRGLFVCPDGTISIYDKRHLFSMGDENKLYLPGRKRTIVEFRKVRFLLNICYDIRFPVWSRNVGLEYDVILNVANFPGSRIEAAHILAKARAIENLSYYLFVNRTGEDLNDVYPKSSIAVDFKGRLVGREVLLHEKSDDMSRFQIIKVEIKKEEMDMFREKFPAWNESDKFTITY